MHKSMMGMVNRRSVLRGAGALAAAAAASGLRAQTPREIVIGALYPRSGPNAIVGEDAERAIQAAMEIVDGDYDLDLPLARLTHLPGIKDARIRILFADHKDSATVARAEADRLIGEMKAVALIGAGNSDAAAAASLVAANQGVPFVDADSLAPELSQRNLKGYFRTAPHNGAYASLVGEFATSVVKSGAGSIRTIAMALDFDAPNSVRLASFVQSELKSRDFRAIRDIPFAAGAGALTSEAGRIVQARADVVVAIGTVSDAERLLQALAQVKYSGNVIFIPSRSAYRRQVFETLGPLGERLFVPSGFAADQAAKKPSIAAINTLYRSLAKRDLDDFSAQQFTAFLSLVAAIDDSVTAQPQDIYRQLQTLEFNGFATIMPWRRLAFDQTGQNTGAQVVMIQRINGRTVTVFPSDRALGAALWRGA